MLEFDVKKNECQEMPPLSRPLTKMATVRWRDQVVVLGGQGEDRQVLNDVFMYDCKTGKITTLPAMLEKRCFCCAKVCMVCSINLDKYFVVFTMFSFLFILSFRPVNLAHRLGIHRCETGYTSSMISLSHAMRSRKIFLASTLVRISIQTYYEKQVIW